MPLSITTSGQTIIGPCEAYDNKTKEKKADIEVYKTNNFYVVKIVKSFTSEKNALCETCKGTNKNKPIIGLVKIQNVKKNGEAFNGGSISDPENGETYKCYLRLINNKLYVRGYIGFSLFGRTQYWVRKE